MTVTNGYILNYAFENCRSLTTIMIGEGVTGVQRGAFSGCTGLQYTIYGDLRYLGNAENPHLVLIGPAVSAITSCVVHHDTKLICESAFYGCSSLGTISFDGTQDEWNAIVKNPNWNSKTGEYTVVCTDGTIPK